MKEENTVELIDYISVIWKRKILIIVITLVCTGIGVGVGVGKKIQKSKNPATSYRAVTVLKFGMKVSLSNTTNAYLIPIEAAEHMVEIIPLKYGKEISKSHGYHLEVKQKGVLPIIELTLKGNDKGVEGALKKIVNELIDDQRNKAGKSTILYDTYIKKLEADANKIQNDITLIETSIKTMKNQEKGFMEHIEPNVEEKKEKKTDDMSVIWNLLYLKTIDKEIDLSKSRQSLRDIQWKLLILKTSIGNLDDYNTRMIGDIDFTVIDVSKKDGFELLNCIAVGGVTGLMISLFIAFFMEYIEESKSRRKGK